MQNEENLGVVAPSNAMRRFQHFFSKNQNCKLTFISKRTGNYHEFILLTKECDDVDSFYDNQGRKWKLQK